MCFTWGYAKRRQKPAALSVGVWTLLVLLNRSIGVSHTKLVSTYCAVSLLNTNASLALEEHCTENGAR